MAKKKNENPIYPEAPLKITRERFCELLSEQMQKGNELLQIEVPLKTQINPNYGIFSGMPRRTDNVEYDDVAEKEFIGRYNRWNDRNKSIYRTSFEVAESIYYHDYESNIWSDLWTKDVIKHYKEEIARLINHMQGDIERVDLMQCIMVEPQKTMMAVKESVLSREIFIVHGHSEAVNQEVARTIEKLGLAAIILREQPNSGKTIIEKFEEYAKDINFAVILLTADDKIEGEDTFRARQNVIFEMGYFMGVLGRKNVMCMLQENVEKPGDIDGVIYTPIDKNGVWKYSLVKELKTCGYDVDANRVL